VNRNGDAHFGSPACPAPYTESRAHLLCSVTHPAQTPVQIALCLNGLGIDSAAVVANQHAQDVVQVLHFDLDSSCFGMTYGIHNSFAADQEQLLLDDRIQRLRSSLHEDSKPQIPTRCDFCQEVGKGLLEARGCRRGRVESP
jgi:hypothetical protein